VVYGLRGGAFAELLLRAWPEADLISIDEPAGGTGDDAQNPARRLQDEADTRLAAFGARSVQLRVAVGEALAMLPDASIDFVYLDAAHDQPSVQRAIEWFWPRIVPGGILAGAAYTDGDAIIGAVGVKRAVDGFCAANSVAVSVTRSEPSPSWAIRKLRAGSTSE
jgi:hypothetical protein